MLTQCCQGSTSWSRTMMYRVLRGSCNKSVEPEVNAVIQTQVSSCNLIGQCLFWFHRLVARTPQNPVLPHRTDLFWACLLFNIIYARVDWRVIILNSTRGSLLHGNYNKADFQFRTASQWISSLF